MIVFIYEALKCPRLDDWKQFAWRNWSVAVPALIGSLVTAIFIYAKLNGPNSLAHLQAYRPVYPWHRFTLTNAHFINDLLYDIGVPDWSGGPGRMAGCISLRVLAPRPAPSTYDVLGGDNPAAVGVHSSPWRRDALYRFV